MIIINTTKKINTINQNIYSIIINSLNLSNLSCPKCDHKGLAIHAYYTRMFKNNSIRITRVRCPHCGSTHSILISPMIPFISSVSCDDMLCIISHSFDHIGIELSHIFYFIRKFRNKIVNEFSICQLNSRNYFLSFITT